MTVQAKGHAPDLRILIVAPNLPPVEFRLGPPHSFRGRVIDLAGAPIAGTSVSVDAWRGYRSLTIKTETDLEGRFQVDDLPDDPVEFQFSKEGFMNLPNQRWSPGAVDAVVTLGRPLRIYCPTAHPPRERKSPWPPRSSGSTSRTAVTPSSEITRQR
jgi:hypothetical protein